MLKELPKERLLEILDGIYLEARDFYAAHQEYWQYPPFMDKALMNKNAVLDDAWNKLNNILSWSDGERLDTLPEIFHSQEDNF